MDSSEERDKPEKPSRRRRGSPPPDESRETDSSYQEEIPAQGEAEPKPRRRRTKAEREESGAAEELSKPARPKRQPGKEKKPAKSGPTLKKVTPKQKKAVEAEALLPAGPPTLRTRLRKAHDLLWRIIRLSPVWGLILLFLLIFGPGLLRGLRSGVNAPPPVSPIFTREVQYWAPQITKWAQVYDVNPNLIATLMQIESCGYPGAASNVGAQGLFQVMPMHFSDSETMTDPDTNARRGIGVIKDCLNRADGDVGLAMACYNGGPRLIGLAPAFWPMETQNYYTWGGGIYNDAVRGSKTSQTLSDWLAAGGEGLCEQAALTLGLATPVPGLPPTATPTTAPVVPTFNAGEATPLPLPSGGNLPTFAVPTATPAVKLYLTPETPQR